ncbi:DNA ligase 4 [Fomitiporia mediterranea MF3/22]|uniref:DNA ligase 4 n=1 Tax=Fomitiporia mediterranea (strain MF3/22) TaxID=694068 RepID=UPI0004407E32|nr:DNA ligase 4 [Fomitiporia mediterranea MF3/22]EJD07416.1 DNA ligase 4 [Fomitiporia mediterranea MF3/22]
MQATPPPTEVSPDEEEVPSHHEPVTESQQQIVYPPAPQNVRSPPFPILAELFDNLANERRQDLRRKRLANWFNGWRRDAGKDLYPVLRLILPQKDRERSVYGLKEKNLAKTYIKLIPLGMKDPDAVRLLNWKRPTERDKTSGDFPTVLYEVVSKRSSVTQGSLTVDQVNDILDQLSQSIGKQDLQSKLLQRIYNSCTPEEQRWVARIILKDMQINVKETTVFAVFHPDAVDLFNACSDLKKVAHELWDPERRLNDSDKQVNLFRAFAPMLCKRPSAKLEDSIKDMQGQPFIIEEKLDGERMQLHKRGNEFFYCSRKGKDYTYLYGANSESGSLTPYIWNAFDERVDEIILDGEMLVWDPVSGRNLPFGTLKTAALDKSKTMANPRPCFKVFDLLYLNGMCLTKRSVKFRKRNLKAYVKEVKGRLEYVTEYEGRSASDVRKRLEEIMANRGEGLIIKHPNSEYILNGRNKDWVKVKPEYMDNMGETVDLLVVGGNYGTGYRSGGVSTLICAVLDDRRTASDDDEPKYSSFVRIGTGLSYADYVWIRQKNWKPFDKNKMPSWYQASKKGYDDKGDIYIEPEDSFILKIKAAEITPSDQYHLGFTMRFPRAVAIRDDLSIADCMSATAVLESMKTVKKRKIEETDLKTKKKRKVVRKPVNVMPEYRGEVLKDVDVQSDIFEGLKFMVASDPRNRNGDKEKKELQKIIHVNGGKYVQIAKGIDPILVVYGGLTIPYDLKLIIDKDIHDIIRPSWIYDCVERGKRLPLHKKYFFHATSDRKLDKEFNEVGEGNTEPSTNGAPAPTAEAANEEESATESSGGEEPPTVKSTEIDPAMADWFKVDKKSDGASSKEVPSDSETDPDSDYDELRFDEEAEEWVLPVRPAATMEDGQQRTPSTLRESSDDVDNSDVRMGEDESAMELDPELIFKHLCFYLDTPTNAERHGMEIKSKYKDQISTSFVEIEDLIVANGGRVVSNLDEQKLTHVVLDKRDISRRKELMQRTSKPKHRYLVLSDFIHACVEEHSLLDEEGFVP